MWSSKSWVFWLGLALCAGLCAASCSSGAQASAGGVAQAEDPHNYHQARLIYKKGVNFLKNLFFFSHASTR